MQFRFCSWNLRGLGPQFRHMADLIREIRPDIIALQAIDCRYDFVFATPDIVVRDVAYQQIPRVAVDPAGRFVVAWESKDDYGAYDGRRHARSAALEPARADFAAAGQPRAATPARSGARRRVEREPLSSNFVQAVLGTKQS